MAYEAQPGTIPHRVIETLRKLAPGVELSSMELAEAVGHEGTAIGGYLRPALEHGAVKCRHRNGYRPLWWSIGDGSPNALRDQEEDPVPVGLPANKPGEKDDDESDSGRARGLAGEGGVAATGTGRIAVRRAARGDRPAAHDEGLLRALAPGDHVGEGNAEQLAVGPESPSPYDFGLFRSGQFIQTKGDQRITLDRFEFESLLSFLDRMAVERA